MEYGSSSQKSQKTSVSFYPKLGKISSCLYPSTWSFILVLHSYIRLGFPRGISLSYFPIKTLYEAPLSAIRATCPAYFILVMAPLRMYFTHLISYHTKMTEMEST